MTPLNILNEPSSERVLILGGGISGLSLAWKLLQRGIPVEIIEAASSLGGLSGTVHEHGCLLDFGPHSFFTEDPEIFQTVHGLFPDQELKAIPRNVKFAYRGRYLDYPFTFLDILRQMGFVESLRAVSSFLKSRFHPHPPSVLDQEPSVQDWAISSFGKHLYQAFFKPYTEQFWKISCAELSSRSIPSHTRLSFIKTLKHLFRRQSRRPGASVLDREKLATYYPSLGYGMIADRIRERIEALGGGIHTLAKVTRVELEAPGVRVAYHQDGEEKILSGMRVVSTLPLPVFVEMIEPKAPEAVLKAAQTLEYRPLLFLGMVIRRKNVLGCSYLYTLDRPYNRITEMNCFSSAASPQGENVIAVEIPCRPDEKLWQASKEELFDLCIPALEQDGILRRQEISRLMLVKSRYAYPVYLKNYALSLNSVLEWIQGEPCLVTLGRCGEFRYMDADQCMRRAFDLGDKIKSVSAHENLSV